MEPANLNGGHQVVIAGHKEAVARACELAKERGLDLHTGTCAVMYVTQGFTYHSIHAWINRALGRY